MKPIIALLILISLARSRTIEYNVETSRELAGIAFAATCSNQNLINWTVGPVSDAYPNFRQVQIFENRLLGTKGFIGYNEHQSSITITFRGSENIQNWLEDFDVVKTRFNDLCGCQVHMGFKDAYLSLKHHALNLFAEYRARFPYAKIQVLGHSLGGALATLFASELSATGYEVLLQTLGSPRVGDGRFYDWFSTLKVTHFRLVHEKDNIPHLPPQSFGFMHVNREIWYHNDGYELCDEVKGEDKKCSISASDTTFNDHHFYMGWDSRMTC